MKKILILIIALFLVSSVNAIDIYDCGNLDRKITESEKDIKEFCNKLK